MTYPHSERSPRGVNRRPIGTMAEQLAAIDLYLRLPDGYREADPDGAWEFAQQSAAPNAKATEAAYRRGFHHALIALQDCLQPVDLDAWVDRVTEWRESHHRGGVVPPPRPVVAEGA